MLFLKRRLTDVEEKVSTYLSIICFEDKKKTKLTSFAIMIFSTIIFLDQQFCWLNIFLPLYLIVNCKSSKFCTISICSILVSFVDIPRRFEVKTAFVLRQWWCCCWKILSNYTTFAASLVTFSPRTIDSPFWKSCKNAIKMQKSGFVLHFHTRSAPTACFGLLYRNILLPVLVVREIDWSKRMKFPGETRNWR